MEDTLKDYGDVAILTISNDYLDASNAAEVREDILKQLDGRSRAILDLSHVTFLDSAGLGGLLSCLRHIASAGGDLKLCGITEEVRVLFDLIRMQRLFDIFTTRDEAVLSFQS
jgi:anti-sigma B factor antagonist